jgi:hypothetical protein
MATRINPFVGATEASPNTITTAGELRQALEIARTVKLVVNAPESFLFVDCTKDELFKAIHLLKDDTKVLAMALPGLELIVGV